MKRPPKYGQRVHAPGEGDGVVIDVLYVVARGMTPLVTVRLDSNGHWVFVPTSALREPESTGGESS